MKKKIFVALVTPILTITGCKATSNVSSGLKNATLKEPVYTAVNKPANYSDFIEHVSEFSSKFTEAALKSKDNVSNYAVSPVSVFMALAMTAESSSGTTRQEILNALGLTYDELEENIHYFINSLNIEFTYEETNYQYKRYGGIKLTNSIWFQKGLTIKEKLLTVLSELYNSYSFQTDFQNENEKANGLVREFIKKQTNGLIDQDLELQTSTLVVLLNTLYFKDAWNDCGYELSFSKTNYDFKNKDSSITSTKLLRGYYYAGIAFECDSYKSFYTATNSGTRLTFIVPNDGYSLDEVFTKDTINECANRDYPWVNEEKMEKYYTECYFPEFSASYNNSLNKILNEEFDIKEAFNPDRADFSNTCNEDLFVSDVKHVVKLEVSRVGIEGAAITSTVMAGSAAPVYTEVYYTFNVDRSFGYILTYKSRMLFSGIVQKI